MLKIYLTSTNYANYELYTSYYDNIVADSKPEESELSALLTQTEGSEL